MKARLIEQAQKIKNGKLEYTTKNWYEFSTIRFVFGDGTVSTKTFGTVDEHDGILRIDATIEYHNFDEFTDPFGIREKK